MCRDETKESFFLELRCLVFVRSILVQTNQLRYVSTGSQAIATALHSLEHCSQGALFEQRASRISFVRYREVHPFSTFTDQHRCFQCQAILPPSRCQPPSAFTLSIPILRLNRIRSSRPQTTLYCALKDLPLEPVRSSTQTALQVWK